MNNYIVEPERRHTAPWELPLYLHTPYTPPYQEYLPTYIQSFLHSTYHMLLVDLVERADSPPVAARTDRH